MAQGFSLGEFKLQVGLIILGVGLILGAIALRHLILEPRSELRQSHFSPAQITPQTLGQNWIVSPEQGIHLIQQGATVLDVRTLKPLKPTIPQAVPVTWQEFSQPDAPEKGNLLEDDALLTKKLRSIGISGQRPVVVIGDGQRGWGEEGRIVWMLRTLGHTRAVWVDGGGQALAQPQVEAIANAPKSVLVGDFMVQRRPDWTIERDSLQHQLDSTNLVILDTRELENTTVKLPMERAGEAIFRGQICFTSRTGLMRRDCFCPGS